MKIIKILFLIFVINILILTGLSKFHYKVYQNIIRYIINSKYLNERKNMQYISINYPPLSLFLYILFKIILIVLIPFASIIFLIFLGYININMEDKNLLRFISCNIKNEEYKYGFIDKYLWFKIFKEFNIPTPEVYAIIKNNKLNIINRDFDYNKKYIIKPIFGMRGRSIEYDSYKNIVKNNLNFGEDMIFQDRIYDCKYGERKPRHIRLHSIYDENNNNVYSLTYLIFDGKEKKIMSNFHQGGKITDCYDLKCNNLSIDEKDKIRQITKKLLHLHKRLKRSMIGWDIILACDKAYVLEGNICPGTERLNDKSVLKYEKVFDSNY